MTRLFHPAAPPDPSWRHHDSREAASNYCAIAFSIECREAQQIPHGEVFFTIPVTLPPEFPKAIAGFWRVYNAILALSPTQVDARDKKKPGKKKYLPIVTACAGDAALALMQLYIATETGLLVDERAEKWAPFAAGYGCIGVYNAQAITYEPPPELDGRAPP